MRLILALTLVFFVFAPGAVALAQCTKDVDCKGDRICVEGACTNPAGGAQQEVGRSSPEQEPSQPSKEERRSEGVFIGGLVLTIVGGMALTAGTTMLILGSGGSGGDGGGLLFGGSLVGGIGVLSVPAGIPMMVWGAASVPVDSTPAQLPLAPWATADGGGIAFTTSW